MQRRQKPVLNLRQGSHPVHAPVAGRALRMALHIILVEGNQGFGLLVIDMQAVAHRVLAVVGTLYEGIPGDIVDTGISRRIVLQVIDPAGGLVNAPAAETPNPNETTPTTRVIADSIDPPGSNAGGAIASESVLCRL